MMGDMMGDMTNSHVTRTPDVVTCKKLMSPERTSHDTRHDTHWVRRSQVAVHQQLSTNDSIGLASLSLLSWVGRQGRRSMP